MKRERKELLLSIWYIIRLAGWYSIRLAIADEQEPDTRLSGVDEFALQNEVQQLSRISRSKSGGWMEGDGLPPLKDT